MGGGAAAVGGGGVAPVFSDAGGVAAGAPAPAPAAVFADEGDRFGVEAGLAGVPPTAGAALGTGAAGPTAEPAPDAVEPAAGVPGNIVSVTTFSVVVIGGVWVPAPVWAGWAEAAAPSGAGADTTVACGRSAR
jgi:hypothetical protein